MAGDLEWIAFTPWKYSDTYKSFTTTVGVTGVAHLDDTYGDSTFYILGVAADKPGTGQFRNFIKLCKEYFKRVVVQEVTNRDLNRILERYGFYESCDYNGLTWEKRYEQNDTP